MELTMATEPTSIKTMPKEFRIFSAESQANLVGSDTTHWAFAGFGKAKKTPVPIKLASMMSRMIFLNLGSMSNVVCSM